MTSQKNLKLNKFDSFGRKKIIVQLNGGTGNQLFQLATCFTIAKNNNRDAYYSPRLLGGFRKLEVKEIAKKLNIYEYNFTKKSKLQIIDSEELNHPAIFSKFPISNFLPNVDILFSTNLQNYRIFSDNFISILKRKAVLDYQKISFKNNNFISIHLRELHASGTNKPLKWVDNLNINYYKRSLEEALSYLKEKQIKEKRCLIFKDTFKDVSRSNLLIPLKKILKENDFEIIDGDELCNSSWEVISLMSNSKVVITSNSSFSWWGAFLSKGLKISPILSLWEGCLCTPDGWLQINDGNINPSIWNKQAIFGKITFKKKFYFTNNIFYKKLKHLFIFYIVPKTFISIFFKFNLLKRKSLLS